MFTQFTFHVDFFWGLQNNMFVCCWFLTHFLIYNFGQFLNYKIKCLITLILYSGFIKSSSYWKKNIVFNEKVWLYTPYLPHLFSQIKFIVWNGIQNTSQMFDEDNVMLFQSKSACTLFALNLYKMFKLQNEWPLLSFP